MKIFIKIGSGELFDLDVDPSDTDEQLKAKIQDESGIPSYTQRLSFLGKELQGGFALRLYHIVNGCTINLRERLLEITVQSSSRRTISLLDIEPTKTIGYVKTKIQERLGITPDEQLLKFGGKILEDSQPLYAYNTPSYFTICLVPYTQLTQDNETKIEFMMPFQEQAIVFEDAGDILPIYSARLAISDETIQFNYLVPFCDTLVARSVGKRLYTVSGLSDELLDWEEMGIKIHVPTGVVPPDHTFCDIAVIPLLRGDFVFPDNSVPVSGLFAIGTSCEIQKPITIELQHCVDVSSKEEASMLVFTKAEHNGKSPYHFKECQGGKFDPGSQFGSLECQSFTLFGIVWWMTSWITGRPDPSIRYKAQLLYSRSSTGQYKVYFVVVKNSKSLIQGVYKDLSNCEEGASAWFSFSGSEIKLEFPKNSENDDWEILTLESLESAIQREDVDAYGSSQAALYKLTFHIDPKPGCSKRLYQQIKIIGATDEKLSMNVVCYPPNQDPQFQHSTSQCSTDSGVALQRTATDSQPTHPQLMNYVAAEAEDKFMEIGLGLGFASAVLHVIEQQYPHQISRCFIEMFGKWLNGDGDITWETVFSVLTSPSVGRADLVQHIREQLNQELRKLTITV